MEGFYFDCSTKDDIGADITIDNLLKTNNISLYGTDLTYNMIVNLCKMDVDEHKLQDFFNRYSIESSTGIANRLSKNGRNKKEDPQKMDNMLIKNTIRQLENIEKIEFDDDKLLPCKIEDGDPIVFNENVLRKFTKLKENIPDSGIIDTLNGMLFKESSQGGKRKSKSVKKSHKPKSKKSKKKPSRRKRRTNRRQK